MREVASAEPVPSSLVTRFVLEVPVPTTMLIKITLVPTALVMEFVLAELVPNASVMEVVFAELVPTVSVIKLVPVPSSLVIRFVLAVPVQAMLGITHVPWRKGVTSAIAICMIRCTIRSSHPSQLIRGRRLWYPLHAAMSLRLARIDPEEVGVRRSGRAPSRDSHRAKD